MKRLYRRAAPVIRDLFETDISVDLFAGGGGASIGTEDALGKPVDIAINHDEVAIAVHAANHPTTEHYQADIFKVSPTAACRGRRVRHLHASPDCRHHSRAAGGKPRSASVRSLADVVIDWAEDVRPDVITLENVPEFAEWGPLTKAGQPIKARKGEYFRKWKQALLAVGYVVEHQVLHAHHFGAPTSRKRFFLVARIDGQPIVWPAASHGPGLKPFKTAAQCIDWSIPCPSIFDRKRPLADATLRRVAAGIVKFVLNNPKPFVVTIDHQSSAHAMRGVDEPLSTVSTKARHCLVTPFVAGCGGRAGQSGPTNGDQPVGTITAKNDRVVVTPTIVKVNHSDKGKTRGAERADEPLSTVTATQRGHAVVAPTMIQMGYGERDGQAPRVLDLHEPLGTIVTTGNKHALVSAFLAQHFGDPNRESGGGKVIGRELGRPMPTITTRDHGTLVTSSLAVLRNNCDAKSVDEPVPTICASGNHIGEIRAFLAAYYGEGSGKVGHAVTNPLPTITTADRFALVTVLIDGVTYAIVDIGLRMLEPHELLKAQFGRFAKHYDLSKATTKKDQVRLIGNSVCPEVQFAVVRANLKPWGAPKKRPPPRATPVRRAA